MMTHLFLATVIRGFTYEMTIKLHRKYVMAVLLMFTQTEIKCLALEYEIKMKMEFCCRPNIDDVKQRWRSDTQWRVERAYIKNKLIVTGDEVLKVFLCEYYNIQIIQYNRKGQFVKQFGSRRKEGDGNLYFPRLFGVDRQSHLLVADQMGKVYKILDLGTGQWRSAEMRGEDQIFDAKLDNDGNLQMCQ